MRVVIASDHGGFAMKKELVGFIKGLGYEVVDYGTHSTDPVDYPDFALLVANAVAADPARTVGIMIDGAGVGSAMAANKVTGVRAAACYDTFTAKNSRAHNDANMLTLGGRVTGIATAQEIVKVWLGTAFEGGRHGRRVEKILQIERRYMAGNR
ncbi:MAG: ribose 5-phosphate isomerase B [bacterium]|nr:ribose 5-phosphate isomerase B [bacterium]